MAHTNLRIHPVIGIARVGNSEEYYLGPESMAGMDIPGQAMKGGLPIKPGTEQTPIMSSDLRDASGKLKRQAARFRIYQYDFPDHSSIETYPNGGGSEIRIGSMVDGKTVKDIVWTVHLANKKANSWLGGEGVMPFEQGEFPKLRNPTFANCADPADPQRLKKLVIDAGPRALHAASGGSIRFDKVTLPCYGEVSTGAIIDLANYPISFPASEDADTESEIYSRKIQTLGALSSESNGRLLVLGGYGLACGFDAQGNYAPHASLNQNVNNDNWLDDTADGPVTAFLIFDDGSTRPVDGSAWVISTDPAYAPQTTNVVTLWDELYTTWLENFALQPAVYQDQKYQVSFKPNYVQDVFPVLRAASLQKWNVSLPDKAVERHDFLGDLPADGLDFPIMNFIRDPNYADGSTIGSPLMPLSLGDEGKSFLSLTTSQYFFMSQWANDIYQRPDDTPSASLGPGELLDKTILFNCLGGRFGPGIEMGFSVRDPNLYHANWSTPGSAGPFRINMQVLDYSKASKDTPFLDVGYTPLRKSPVQPGDFCKFMALPWHTDYNSCATHLPDPNPGGELTDENIDAATDMNFAGLNTFTFASWPAQRPVAVYTYRDVVANNGYVVARDGTKAVQRFSVRGNGTKARRFEDEGFNRPAMNTGRYQDRKEFLLNWSRVGFILQSRAIAQDADAPSLKSEDYFLEVSSQFETDESNLVEYWPNTVIDKLYAPEPEKKK
ncbi:LodA/GoxA family CTQ-dependent oxidase [Undibacterium sp. Di26W]|uniref:LodA/GoxA family CTQ-dependent oxidase n=1 Tax=Undibacterium sp. Di26W TaxID=3413035 RepID=UPI003BF43F4C